MSDKHDDNTGLKQQLLDSGHASFDAGDYTRALDFYHRAALLDTGDTAVWTALGLTFNNLDFPREAWRSYLLALNLDPRSANTLWYAAEFLFEIEDLPLADLFLGHYLTVEEDAERIAEARQMRDEIHAEARTRGVPLEQPRGGAATSMLAGEGDAEVRGQLEGQQESEQPRDVREDAAWQMSDEELEQLALQGGRFVPPLALRLSGFEGICQHCNLQIPYDAPYCWSCKMIHFYD